MKTIAIIGSTGSIGSTTLKIIKKNIKKFKIVFLYADKNYKKLNYQCRIFKPKYVSLNSINLISKIKSSSVKLYSIDSFISKNKKIDYVISAVSGYAALYLNFKLLKITKNLLIANKETLICGGKIFLNQAKKFKCKIFPIDSEHYCINYFLNNFKLKKNIRNFYITASGGPFLKSKPKNISIKKTLNHPNWKMGKKISVNSANLINKVMELFEAHILFKIPIDKLKIKIENSSKIHSIIALNNGLDFMISHKTTMRIPIENTLFNDTSHVSDEKNIIFLPSLNFKLQNPKITCFPIIKTGYNILKMGPAAMIIFTVLNDRLVEMFLNNKKKFNDIVLILIKMFRKFEIVNYSKKCIKTIQDIKETIEFAKKIIL